VEEIYLGEITLTKYGMLYIEEFELAVMADFHIGYEDVMAQKGIYFPKIQKKYILKTLQEIYDKYEPKTLLIDGDFKHEFSRNMPQEWDEIEEVLDYIMDMREVIIVRGNHDNFLKSILRRRGLELKDSYAMGNYFFTHGHKDMEIKNITIIGHEHPSVMLRDEISASVKMPCFLYSPDLIVLPATSVYASGTDITKNEFISPILRKNRRDFEIFAIDEKEGIYPVGKLSSLLRAPSAYC